MVQSLSFGYHGDDGLGDQLLAAALRGEKTATSSLAVEYLSGEPLPRVGERLDLMDHAGRVHGTVETTRVTITPLHLVDDQVAKDEGESFADATDWRRAHIAFWAKVIDLVRSDAGDPGWELREAEPVVVQWFRLLERREQDGEGG
ncbi:MAG: ASCH domain-containing protein [Nocardioidaceae bacterium]